MFDTLDTLDGTAIVERYAKLGLGIPPVSEVAHRVIINSYGDHSEEKLIKLANTDPVLFDKVVLDHLKIRQQKGLNIEPELVLHHSWNHRRLLNHFLESESLTEDDKKLSLGIHLIDDNKSPWSKVEEFFRGHAAKMLSEIACSDLVQIEVPRIGETIEKRIGNITVSNSFLLNELQTPFTSVYEFAKA